MMTDKPSSRELKKRILSVLEREELDSALAYIQQYSPGQTIGPLFSLFYHGDGIIHWRAITAMGVVVNHQARTEGLEPARVVMRRMMWNLNDESGGIGWGSPEAMGEIMARNKPLAEEFGNILISYIMPEGNFLEHERLQRGLLWGMGRWAHARPDMVRKAVAYLLPFMKSDDPYHRGLAAWAAGPIADAAAKKQLEKRQADQEGMTIYRNGELTETTVGELAREALQS